MRRILVFFAAACGGTTPPKAIPTDLPSHAPAIAATRPASFETSMPKLPWPDSRKESTVDTIHGKQIADPYRWLEDASKPEVQAWMHAEDDYARSELAKLPHRDELSARLKELLYFDAIGAPLHKKGRYFFTRKHVDKEKTVVYWKQGENGEEKILFDPNTWASDGTKGLGGWWPSRDGTHVAYSIKLNNSDESTTKILDVSAGKDLPEELPGTRYAEISWTPDGKGFYYVWVPPVGGAVTEAERPGFAELRYHALGSDPAKDPTIHEKTGSAETFLDGEISRDGHWLVATIQHGWNASDVFIKDARAPKSTWLTLSKGVDATFSVQIWQDKLYVTTNDGAPRYRVFKVDPKTLDRKDWKEIIPQTDATLDGISIVGGHIVATYLRNASTEMEVHTLDGKLAHKIELPPLGSASGMLGNPDEDTGYFSYTSFTQPQVIYKASIKTGKVEEWARVKLPIDASRLETQQVFYPSKDGTKISMFVISKKGTPKNGANPTILYGYGGFNVNMTPSFAASRIVWLERGGVYAIPNLRGGGEYGEEWHRAGMLLAKQNVFDDFIAAAETLIKDGWTSHEHLAISGGSNGGLLVGATVTQRPDLFRAAICAVPLLDMLRYHLSGSGKTWVPEYGSADNADQFEALYGYSPYRVAVDAGAREYPAVLFDSADHDDRVDPMHARKLAAVLQGAQKASPERSPILLRIEKNSGHGGADMVKQQVDRATDQLAFLAYLLR